MRNKAAQDKYYKANREKLKADMRVRNKTEQYRAKNRARSVARYYCVYSHTNSKGDLYIGEGSHRRPQELSKCRRSKKWLAAFGDGDVTIKILGKMATKLESRSLERKLISSIGLDNLINSNK